MYVVPYWASMIGRYSFGRFDWATVPSCMRARSHLHGFRDTRDIMIHYCSRAIEQNACTVFFIACIGALDSLELLTGYEVLRERPCCQAGLDSLVCACARSCFRSVLYAAPASHTHSILTIDAPRWSCASSTDLLSARLSRHSMFRCGLDLAPCFRCGLDLASCVRCGLDLQ